MTWKCADCGIDLDESYCTEPRVPCPGCGSPARNAFMSAEAVGSSSVTAAISAQLGASDERRGWHQRWTQIEAEGARLGAPSTEPFTGPAMLARRHELHGFYVQCYHLKDALIADAPKGVRKQAIEDAITRTPTLALIADLGNLDKHVKVTSAPRSAHWPSYGTVGGASLSVAAGWQLKLVIHHGAHTLDGIDVATDAVQAWRQVLTAFTLI